MRIKKQSFTVLAILMLLVTAPVFAKKGGNGNGGGGNNGGGDTCEPGDDQYLVGRLVEASQPTIGLLNFDGYRLGGIVAAELADGSILAAVTGATSPNVSEATDYLVILRYDGSWNFIQEIDIDTFDLKAGGDKKLVDLEGDGYLDLLFGSQLTNKAAVIEDVEFGGASLIPLLPDQDAEFFGSGVAFDGNYIYVGARATNRNEGAVYIFSPSNLGLLRKLTPPTGGEGHFGRSLAVGPSGDLYVSAQWASTSRQTRESGMVFHYDEVLSLQWEDPQYDPVPIWLTRDIRGEELGHEIAVANIDDLVAVPWQGQDTVALFQYSSMLLGLEVIPADYRSVDGLSIGDLDTSGFDEIAFSHSSQVLVYLDPPASTSPDLILTSPDTCDNRFGRGMAIAGGYLFVADGSRDINENGTQDGQIYVYDLSSGF